MGPQDGEVRFVVLHHTGVGREHFDLLIEEAGREELLAWRIYDALEMWDEGTAGERMAEHRRVYLNYEGAVSKGRGEVRRVWEGWARVEKRGGRMEVELRGEERVRRVRLPL